MTNKKTTFRSIICIITTLAFLSFQKAEASQIKASSFGYNSSDATSALVAAFKSNYDTVIVDYKSAGWNVGPLRIYDVKNKVIIFESGVVLRAITGRFKDKSAKLLNLTRAVNVTIIGYGAKFKMNKAEYTNYDPQTEYRFNLMLQDCANITVKGLTIEESGGDGVYINGNSGKNNIVLEDLNVINHSRSGLTVVSVDGLLVKNCSFSGTSGAIVGSGIKFEPDHSEYRLLNVRLEDCKSFNNGQAGITFGLRHMNSSSLPIDVLIKDCYLSNNSIESRNNPKTEILISNGNNHFQPVKGLIRFENLLVENARESLVKSRKVATAFKTEFVNCIFKIRNGSSTNPILLETPAYGTYTGPLGGFTFTNTQISYSGTQPCIAIYGSKWMDGLKDVVGGFLIANPNLTESTAIVYKNVTKYNNVNINYDLVSQLPTGGGGGGSGDPAPAPDPTPAPGNCVNTLNLTSNINSAVTKQAAGTLTASNDVLHGSGTVVYKAGDKVSLKPGFSMSADGSEKFKATIGDCTGSSSSLKARIYPYSSPSEEETEDLETNKPVVYPNPVADHADLRFLLEEDDTVTINVYDAKYQLVVPVVNQLKMTKGEQNQDLDLSSLTQGLYFVSIEGVNSEHGIIKLIKK